MRSGSFIPLKMIKLKGKADFVPDVVKVFLWQSTGTDFRAETVDIQYGRARNEEQCLLYRFKGKSN